MKIIDADAHVIENESTWDYMLESERQFKPKVVGATSVKLGFGTPASFSSAFARAMSRLGTGTFFA